MSTHVRRMRWEDIPQVRGIDLDCFPTMMPPTNYETEYINPMAHYLVAYDEALVPLENASGERLQTIFGFIGLWLMAGEIHIINLAVSPYSRRQGVGELLLIHGIELSMELKAILMTLEVRPSNLAAQSLYGKYGFSERGVRRAYYLDNGEDASIMTLDNMDTPEYNAALCSLKTSYLQMWKVPVGETVFVLT
ncbi:MAG: ribosomal protein S18-alanine N-acetyltransferase [Dehalococcoidia bacterium]|nr:ribosomal protein S18-alanine N-acetyltransferase [Dehalococcoidia bacterium]